MKLQTHYKTYRSSKIDRYSKELQGIWIAALLLLSFSFSANAQSYCSSDGGSGHPINIDQVIFGDIDNVTGSDQGYGDYTNLTTNATPGTSVAIELDPNGPWWVKYRWRAWLDLNADGDFDDAGELVLQEKGYGTLNSSIAIPGNAQAGNTRMRISLSVWNYVDACANYSKGEVEDYTVNILADCEADAGTLTADMDNVCLDGTVTISATPNGDANVPAGYSTVYVLTEGTGLVIQDAGANPSFDVTMGGNYTIHTLVYDPNTLDLSIVVPGQTTGFDVYGLIVPGGGSICASLDVAGAPIAVEDPQAGTLTAWKSEECLVAGGVQIGATPNGDINVPSGYSTVYVLTEGTGLVIQDAGATPEFTVMTGGNYTIHTLVYDPNTLDLSIVVPGQTTGFDVNGLLVQGGGTICASLDVAGAPVAVEDPMAGTLTADMDNVCLDGTVTISATPNGDANVPAGYSTVYVLTEGTGLVIQDAGANPSFDVMAGGNYTIHTLVYDPNTLDLSIVVPGQTTGFDVYGLIVPGGGSICASLDVAGAPVAVEDPQAGTLTAWKSEECLVAGGVQIGATPNGDINVPSGYSTVYVLTEGAGLVIQDAGATPEFTVMTGGNYTIHTLVYDPNTLDLSIVVPGQTTGFDVNGLLVQGGGTICASLDVAGAPVAVEDPMAGTLTADMDNVCLDGTVTISATPNGDANVPAGYSTVYVLTEGTGLVIQDAGAAPSFDVMAGGNYTIHTLVYDPNTLDLSIVVPGQTTGFDVYGLIVPGGGSICASLDVAGAPVAVEDPQAGTLTAWKSEECLVAGGVQIGATPNGDINVPSGYSTVYVLTEGAGLVIQDAGATPEFTVMTGGNYTIHTLVYDPNTLDLSIVVPGQTTGFDVNGLLVQGGGTICASLDVAGAPVAVEDPMAGTLTADMDNVCLDGTVTISATPNGDANVPAGYSTVYVLTEGTGLVIQDAGANPSFDVTMGGNYTIHTLVYDPNTLDLSIVVPGQTTGFDVYGLIVPGGGSICASLDVAGAPVAVEDPQAGTLTADSDDVCLFGGSATISATPNNDANVPAGYNTVYVLTEGTGLVIQDAGATPEFTVMTGGNYTIHTLVYDPNTLDLSIVVPGQTTGFDVNGLLVQGGGTICASLDVAGAPVAVSSNDPNCVCEANAGTLTAWKSEECLIDGGVEIGATPNGNANVPAGYSTVYVLTEGSGLVIQNAGADPFFTVNEEGSYTIHTLVYDPNTLDLSIVVPGQTTGFDVNDLLIQGGGSICASLDVMGAVTVVNGPDAGSIYPDQFFVCLNNGSANLAASPNGDDNVPAGYNTVYVLTKGQGLVIENAGGTPEFTVNQPGLYRIHTLVYDPNTLDLSIVVPGQTTGFDVFGLIAPGGGSICADLDVAGAPFLVLNSWWCGWWYGHAPSAGQDPMDHLSSQLGTTTNDLTDTDLKNLTNDSPVTARLYPVPATTVLNVDLNAFVDVEAEISVLDITGRVVIAAQYYELQKGMRTVNLNVSDLDEGQYLLRIDMDDEVVTERFMRMR